MAIPKDTGLEFQNYKSFKDHQTLNEVKLINIIIGRNNSGKSSILDVIEYLRGDSSVREELNLKGTLGNQPSIFYKKTLLEEDLRATFNPSASGGSIPGNHWEFAVQNLLNKKATILVNDQEQKQSIHKTSYEFTPQQADSKRVLAKHITNPFSNKKICRLLADRNISPEMVSNEDREIKIERDGTGATRAIYNILNYAKYDPSLVEKDLVEGFNKIFSPDIVLSRIYTKDLEDGSKEIFLEDSSKAAIALSDSGSGVKTVILLLLNTIVIPKHYKLELSEYVFLFEELENNLHANAQRNLFSYLREIAVKENCNFFVTTHSSTVIDLFENDNEAQILHISKDSSGSKIEKSNQWSDNISIIDDLGIKGSDLIQSNGIVWVEGPSDRIYINRWIEIISNGELKDGRHYQCIFYGGKLLSHLNALDPLIDQYISMLRVNKNIAVVIDSDRKNSASHINQTKSRIKREVLAKHGLVWITKGREIENYLSKEVISKINPQIKTESLYRKATTIIPKGSNKVKFAREIAPLLEEHDLHIYDLYNSIKELDSTIRSWNK